MATDLSTGLLAALLYALLGIVIFVVAFVAIEKMTPGTLWKELLEDQNSALAILLAGLAIAVSIIIAAAIH
jgi:putative membrane protein